MLALIVTHLKTSAGTPFRHVDQALALSSIQSSPPRQTPAAYVVPTSSQGGPNTTGTLETRQQKTIRFGVVIIQRVHDDAAGTKRAEEIETLIGQTEALLVGFSLGETFTPITFIRGSLVHMGEGEVWWLHEFSTDTILRG